MVVLDEHGEQWEVARGDPASGLTSALSRQGFQQVVLPREALATGRVGGADTLSQEMEQLCQTYLELEQIPGAGDALLSLQRAFLLQLTLWDCCQAARKVL